MLLRSSQPSADFVLNRRCHSAKGANSNCAENPASRRAGKLGTTARRRKITAANPISFKVGRCSTGRPKNWVMPNRTTTGIPIVPAFPPARTMVARVAAEHIAARGDGECKKKCKPRSAHGKNAIAQTTEKWPYPAA